MIAPIIGSLIKLSVYSLCVVLVFVDFEPKHSILAERFFLFLIWCCMFAMALPVFLDMVGKPIYKRKPSTWLSIYTALDGIVPALTLVYLDHLFLAGLWIVIIILWYLTLTSEG